VARTRSFDTGAVLDQVVDLFWQHGYDGVAMHDVCAATGLNPGSLYAAFGDKQGLFVQAMQRYIHSVSQQAIERLHRPSSGMAGIRDYFVALLDAMVDGKRQWGCLVTNTVVAFATRDPAVAEAFRLHLTRLEAAFASAVERAKQTGEIDPGIATGAAAAFLVCTVQGLNVLARTRPGRPALEQVCTHALRSLQPCAAAAAPRKPTRRTAVTPVAKSSR
jgi:TetR/AcrR family transcriptional repressor of nem operon